VLRAIGQISISAAFIIIDALVLQMTKVEEKIEEKKVSSKEEDKEVEAFTQKKGHGSVGRQMVFMVIEELTRTLELE
jgi:hypothetical protein